MSFRSFHRELCPRCGSYVRSLCVAGQAVRHHQCIDCGYRYDNVQETPDEHGALDGFACLDTLPEDERDTVESLALLMLGSGILVGALELTSRVLADFVGEHGAPMSTLRGFAYPVHKWLLGQVPRFATYFIVIDQGQWRASFTMRRLSPMPVG